MSAPASGVCDPTPCALGPHGDRTRTWWVDPGRTERATGPTARTWSATHDDAEALAGRLVPGP